MNRPRFLILSAFCVFAASGQTIVEHSVLTGASSTAAAGSAGVSKSVGGILHSLSDVADKASGAQSNSTTSTPPASQPGTSEAKAPSKSAPTFAPIDPAKITEGLDRDTLIQTFGQPMLRLTAIRDDQFVEKLWYKASSGRQVEITLIDNKVVLPRHTGTTTQDAPPQR